MISRQALAAALIFCAASTLAAGAEKLEPIAGPTTASVGATIQLSDRLPRVKAPGSGRLAIQLTSGGEACYPLYYFIPSITLDAHYFVYHRYEKKEVQLWRLDLRTAETVQLTHAEGENTDWHPWNAERGLRGVMDYRAALNAVRNIVVYFDGPVAHAISLDTLRDETIFQLPPGREAIGQNCVTPDGKWFIYINAPSGSQYGKRVDGVISGWNFDTHEQRSFLVVAHAIHHVMPCDDSVHLVINHPPVHNGTIWADMSSGQWTELRLGDPGAKGQICHQCPTALGIAYEAFGEKGSVVSGLYDPPTRRRLEFRLPDEFGYTHTGFDPQGRIWMWEQSSKIGHNLWFMEKLDKEHGPTLKLLAGDWPIKAIGQRGHMHPRLTHDHRWIQMTGADEQHRAQAFLLDASDIQDTGGISRDLLSATGENDVLTPARLPEPGTDK